MTLGEFALSIPHRSLAGTAALGGAAIATLITPLWAFVIIVLLFLSWATWKLARLALRLTVALTMIIGTGLVRKHARYPHLTEYCLTLVVWAVIAAIVIHIKS